MKSHRVQLSQFVLAFGALLFLAACGGGQTEAPAAPAATDVAAATAAPATAPPATTAPEPTAAPTTAPEPTATTPPTTAPEPTQPPAPTAAMAAGDRNLDEVLAAAQAQLAQMGYRSRILSESAGATTEITVEFVAPDRYHVVTDAMEMIVIADKTYMNQGGVWMQVPMDMGAMLAQFKDPTFTQEATGFVMSNPDYKGVEDLDGVATDLYEYDSTTTVMGTTDTGHTQLWIDRETGLPLKSVNVSELEGVESVATVLYEYPSDLKIEAPIK